MCDSVLIDPAVDYVRLKPEEVPDLYVGDSAFSHEATHIPNRHTQPHGKVVNVEKPGCAVLCHDRFLPKCQCHAPLDSLL